MIQRILELAGVKPAQMTNEQVLHILMDALDDMAKQAIQQLHEVDFNKIEKLRALAYHANTPPGEKAAALAALQRLLPPRPPQPEAPEGGYVNKGKVFSHVPGDQIDAPPPRPNYTTPRGKSFS